MGLRLLAVAFLVGAAFAGPLQRDAQSQCATRCPSSSEYKLNYEPGRNYVYDYQGVNHVTVAGDRKTTATVSGKVEIHVKSKCELVLRMQNVQLDQKATEEETADMIRQLESPLPFAFEDGKIEHVCPSDEETQQSLNIKKGVLSAFINSMDQLERSQEVKETDPLGTCMTRYTVERVQQERIVIEKEKEVKTCTNRHSSITSLLTEQYQSPESAIHTLPIFPQEHLTCKQVLEEKVLKSIECKELSRMKPLTHRGSIIEFEGLMKLELIQVRDSEKMPRHHSIDVRDPIQYQLHAEESSKDEQQKVEERLREMCSKNTQTIDLSVSKDFIALVASVKRLSYQSLQQVYSALENGRLCSSKKLTDLFLDTLPMAGNDAAVQLMVRMLLEKKVSGLKAKLWTASLALVSRPSQEAIKAVVPLIQEQKTHSVLLGVSSMVYRYCSDHKCQNEQSIRQIVDTLNELLGHECSFENEKQAIAALKAFGNMGQLLQAERNILACAKDSDKNIRVRLAAIEAFRRTKEKKPEQLLSLYTNQQEHFEVRIAALSSVLPNADREQIRSIKRVVEQESHEQVSAYAESLIANLNKTSSPLKKNVRQLLGEIRVKPAAKVGYWENSKNIELSLFNEAFNAGGAVELDIIHSSESKIPRSLRTRFDIDLFDHHMNILEVGLRAEGLEAAIQKLLGLEEAKKQKSSWNLLGSSGEDDKTQASVFFRTMDTEVIDLSIEDFTGIGQMIKIADVLNKISQEKSADFSHSFMFLNSKVIIPSVTGRSYSFGLTGSATVGLTASSKVDIVNLMSKPKNGHVHAHFQPSVNVEIAATVGVHSSQPRPDLKIVTRLHSESDVAAEFQIKDGHLGLIKVSLPSENVLLTRVSSDIVEIDAEHQERRVEERMQTKLDYCFDKLEKPLGLSVCGKWEVPRPFLSKTFPFVKGVSNMELAIKKTDASMKGYELSFEIPKHKSQHLKYRVALDTPGSEIKRRFAADLDVQMPSRDQKQFSLQIQSPFRSGSVSASGSLIQKAQLIEVSLDVQAGSSRRYSIKASTPISESGSQKILRPSIQVSSSSSSQPLKIDGTITLTKGRKEEITFDLKSNKPSRKPVILKGSIVKDGTLSKTSEWKISSDVAVKTPIVNMQIRSATEKQSKQAQTSLTIDYQRERSARQTVKLSARVQKSSSKFSSVAQLDTTEYPSANFVLTWNMQGKIRESLKNDITLKYGRNPEQQYINVLQSSRMSENQVGENKIIVKAPQFDIDSELNIAHDIKMKSRLHADVQLRYKEDKQIKAKLHLDNQQQKLKIKAEIETPNRRMSYQDELEKIDSNTYKGNAVVEWRANRKAELQYKFQKMSDRSKIHHEIETTLRLPNSRSPIKSQASIQIRNGNLGIEGQLIFDRRSEYSVKANLNKVGTSHVSLKVPKIEGNLKVVNDQRKKAADLDLKLRSARNDRHIIASATLGLGSEKKIEAEIVLDADRSPERKILISSAFERKSRNTVSIKSKVQILDKANIEISAAGDAALQGAYEASFQGQVLDLAPLGLEIKHEMRPSKLESTIKISKNQRPKIEIAVRGDFSKSGKEYQLATAASLKSLDNSFQTKRWSSKQLFSRSGSVLLLKSNAKLEWSSSKVYESEINYDFQPSMVLMKANLHTPHINYEKQSVGFSFRKSRSAIVSSAIIELPNGKSLSISSETKQKDSGSSSTLIVSSPFDIVKNAKVEVTWENEKSKKSLKSTVTVNGDKLSDVELSMKTSTRITEIRTRVKTSSKPEISAQIVIEKQRESFKYDVQVKKDSSPILSAVVSKQVSNGEYSYALQSSSHEKTLVNLKISKEVSREATRHVIEAQGPSSQPSLLIESEQRDSKSLTVQVRACQKSEEKSCFTVKAYHKSLINEESYRYYRKLTLDVEKISQNSNSETVAKINIGASIKGNDYREKLTVETKEKKLGYEFRLHLKDHEEDRCSLESNIYMPRRTIRVTGSLMHQEKSLLLNFEVVPDITVSDRKLALELKHERDHKEISGTIKLQYPGWRKAIELSGHVQKQHPVNGELKLDSSAVGGKSFKMEIASGSDGKSMEYKLYSEDKKVDISAKLTKRISRDESEYSYEWSWQSQRGQQKEGRVALRLSEKRNGKPQAVEFEIVSPRVSSKISSHITWGRRLPSSVQLTLETDSKTVAEVQIQIKDECLVVEEQLNSRPFMKTQLCIGKTEADKLKLISIKSQYQRKRAFEFEIEVDQKQTHLAQIHLKWDRRSIRQALTEARQVASEIQSRHISDEDLQSIQQIWRQVRDSSRQAVRDMKQKIRKMEIASTIWNFLTHYIPVEYIQENYVKPIVESFQCLFEKYVQFVRKHLPEVYRAMWETTKKEVVECLKTYCPRDSFCYEVASILEHFNMARAKSLVSRRLRDMQKRIRDQVPIVEWIERFASEIRKWNDAVYEWVSELQMVQNLRNYARKMEEIGKETLTCTYEKIINWIKHMLQKAERDEDFRILKAFVEETKEKAVQTWKRRESIVKDVWQPLKESFLEDYPRKWVKDRMTIQRFAPKEGNIQIEIHHPLKSKHIQVLQNAFLAMRNKVIAETV